MIYLDNAATTKPNLSALKQAEIYLTERYFNPSGKYKGGVSLTGELNQTRDFLLSSVGRKSGSVIFTSCGSEADNTAIFCHKGRGKCVTTAGEHSAVLEAFSELNRRGTETAICGIDQHGAVDVEELLSLIDEKTAFVSVMHVNNETGAINDVNRIAKEVKKIAPRCVFHSDGVQALGKIPVALSDDVDLYSVSAHKVGGLKGVGALMCKDASFIHPFIFGGGQENGMRGGTENVFGIKSYEYALKDALSGLSETNGRIFAMREKTAKRLEENDFLVISPKNGSPYILNVSAGPVRGEVLLHMLEEKGILVGTGSACSSKNRFSRVIRACGYGEEVLDGVIRISFCAQTTEEEAEFATEEIISAANKLKKVMRVTKWKKSY